MKTYIGIIVTILMASSGAFAGPGYVSRDCPAFGTKESITLDWAPQEHIFKTRSLMLFTDGRTELEWYNGTSHTLYDFPSPKGQPSTALFLWGEKVHAGFTLNGTRFNQYDRGVQGWHYWVNPSSGRVESRVRAVTSCQLLTWGAGNW